MTNKQTIQLVLGAVVLLVVGFVLGVYATASNQDLAGTDYDATRHVGDVYNGQLETLMMKDGRVTGPAEDLVFGGSKLSTTTSGAGTFTAAQMCDNALITATPDAGAVTLV